jgi:hypothetical protein
MTESMAFALIGLLRSKGADLPDYDAAFMNVVANCMEELLDDSNKFYALMDTLNVDFNDMFPDWGKDED